MPQSLAQIYLHIVFSTKFRQPFLLDKSIRNELHAYIGGLCRNLGCASINIGGVEDHVHLLVCQSRTITVAELLQEIKRDSSKWVKRRNSSLSSFQWQRGYGAFSVSRTHLQRVKNYIQNQEEHHRKQTFKNEFRSICRYYDIEIDERYVWD